MNIKVYKVIFQDGKIAFERKKYDDREAIGCSNIRELTKIVKEDVNKHHQKDNLSLVSVDFTPFHNFEHPSSLSPRLCEALSTEEKMEFWKYYNSQE